jgi:hypothetical protein
MLTKGSVAATETPAVDLRDILHVDIQAAGYDYIEEVTSGGVACRVYKSNAADNAEGYDWFLYMRVGDNASNISFSVSEVWDATNKLAKRFVPFSGALATNLTTNALAATSAADYTYDSAGVNPASSGLTTSTDPCFLTVFLDTAGFSWVCSATYERVVVGAIKGSNESSNFIYAGQLENFVPAGVGGREVQLGVFYPKPQLGTNIYGVTTTTTSLLLWNNNTTNNGSSGTSGTANNYPGGSLFNNHGDNPCGGFTREPNVNGARRGNFTAAMSPLLTVGWIPDTSQNADADSTSGDFGFFYYATTKILVVSTRSTGTVRTRFIRGAFYDLHLHNITNLTGTDITYDGNPYVVVHNSSSTTARAENTSFFVPDDSAGS